MKKIVILALLLGLLVGCQKVVPQQQPQPQPIIVNPPQKQNNNVIVVPQQRPGIHIDINANRPGYHCCPHCRVWVQIGGHHHCHK